MNHCINELWETIEAVGAENSHARMKAIYCESMPTLLTFMFNCWSQNCSVYPSDLYLKMEDLGVKKEHTEHLLSAINFYHNVEIRMMNSNY